MRLRCESARGHEGGLVREEVGVRKEPEPSSRRLDDTRQARAGAYFRTPRSTRKIQRRIGFEGTYLCLRTSMNTQVLFALNVASIYP